MPATSNAYPRRAFVGLVLALAIGGAVVGASHAIRAIAAGLPPLSEWPDAGMVQVAIVSAPFVLLALLGVDARRSWLTGLTLTATLWAFYTYAVTRSGDGGDANIGLGILMMTSPAPIAIVSLLSLRYRKRPTVG